MKEKPVPDEARDAVRREIEALRAELAAIGGPNLDDESLVEKLDGLADFGKKLIGGHAELPVRKVHNHPEAFCLMLYASDDRRNIEALWNSRDGVTPFIIGSRLDDEDNQVEERELITHTSWSRDPYAPFHVPNVGERIFVDLTEFSCRANIRRYIERYWDEDSGRGSPGMAETFGTKARAEDELVESWMKPGAPDVVVVTAELQRTFFDRRPK